MLKCKNCESTNFTKSGKVNNKPRFHCKTCGCHFTEGDGRTNEQVAIKKALCVILYASGKASFRTFAKIFNTSPSLTYRWIVEAGCSQRNQETHGEIGQMEFNNIWDYIKTKAPSFEASKPLSVVSGELWPGYSTIVLLQQLDDKK
jgi:transposase-like protein